MRKCAHCGREIRGRFGRRFCSDVCRSRAQRRRRLGLPEDFPEQEWGVKNTLVNAARMARRAE